MADNLPVPDDAPWLDCMDAFKPMDELHQASAAVSGVEVLSPVAEAILDAGTTAFWSAGQFSGENRCVAAVLRTAASQLSLDWTSAHCMAYLRAIATELDPPTS